MGTNLIDIVDEHDNIVGVATRKEMRAKKLRHRTSFVLVFNSRGDVFITRRSKTKDYEPGKWEIGQGGVAEQGESYEDNARRELFEELGVSSTSLEYLFDFKFSGKKGSINAKAYRTIHEGPFKLQKSEISEGRWISIAELKTSTTENPEQFAEDSPPFLERYLDSRKK